MRIVVAGGTGFLGSALVARLRAGEHEVTVLTRSPGRPGDAWWDPREPPERWAATLDGADAVVNLTGSRLDKRWTGARRRAIRSSRVGATRALAAALASAPRAPSTFVSASGVGIYGARGDEPLTEESPTGDGFLADLGREWEAAALSAAPAARVVMLRSGVVLDRSSVALRRMRLPFLFLVGGPLGSGRQYLPWIHKDDWLSIAELAIANGTVSGPVNATAPAPVTNREFARALGRALHRPALVPAPAFAIRLVFGEMSEMVLTGQRALPARAQAAGFRFRYPDLDDALHAIYSRRT